MTTDSAQSINVFPYGPHILWEKPIQTVAELFVRPGQDILDVGANTGGLAIAFARLTGAGGRVLAFECNPRMIDWCRGNFEVNDTRNVSLVSRACYREAGLTLQFVCENSPFAGGSSLMQRNVEGQIIDVTTTTIDVECARLGMRPAFIKIDVEGAETDVLEGARETIARHAPVIVFERMGSSVSPESDPLAWAHGAGLRCYDVNTLEPVEPGWPGTRYPNNILAVPHVRDPKFKRMQPIGGEISPDGLTARTGRLAPGLYVIRLETEGAGAQLGSLEVRNGAGERILYFEASTAHLADPCCASFPVKINAAASLTFIVTGRGFAMNGISVEPIL